MNDGYIDLHTHGIAGADAHSAMPEEYLWMAETLYSHGTGAFLPTLFPGTVDEMRAQMKAVRKAMEMQISITPPIPPLSLRGGTEGGVSSARILGVNLEGPFVNPARAGALDRRHIIKPDTDTFARLLDGFEGIVRIITVAPELPGALGLIEKAAGMGIRVNMGHSEASFDQAADGRLAGASGVTHLFNAMPPLHHRVPGLAGYALVDDGLFVEVIADLRHIHPAALSVVLKCKPVDQVLLVSDSVGPAKTEGVPYEGPIYMADGKTLAGSGITLKDAVENLVTLGVPRETAARFASDNPAKYLGP